MKLKLSLTAMSLLISACGTLPKTPDAFREWTKTSSHADRKEINIPGADLAVMKQRMTAFSDRCLNKIKEEVSMSRQGPLMTRSRLTTEFNPRIISKPGRVSLVLQRKQDVGHDPFNAIPKGGFYYFIADAEKSGTGVKVKMAAMRNPFQVGSLGAGMGNILQDGEGWMRGTGEFCPKMQ